MQGKYRSIISLLAMLSWAISAYAATPKIDLDRTRQKARQSLLYSKQKGYNTRYCILIDMSLPSGIKRFLVWDFKKNNILVSGLVSHGCGKSPWSGVWSKDKPAFSDLDGSHCTALGKYQISGRAYSAWGLHMKYYLNGLENTNKNALARQIVFHSWEKVSDNEVYPNGTPGLPRHIKQHHENCRRADTQTKKAHAVMDIQLI